MEITLYTQQGVESGKIDLPKIFETKISQPLLHEVIVAYNSNQRFGTHSTKTRGEVSGGGAKPWREKGTGRARAGSIRSPLWRKGGIIFGPKPRDYYQNISSKKRRQSLVMALSAQASNNNIIVLEDISLSEAKTKNMAEILKRLNIKKNTNTLIILNNISKEIKLASRNIKNLKVLDIDNINTYLVLWAKKLLFTKDSLFKLEEKYRNLLSCKE